MRVGRAVPCIDAIRHLGERLGTPFRSTIKRHLLRCPNCTEYLNSLKEVVQLYKRYPVPKTDDQLRRHLENMTGHLFNHNKKT